MIVFSQAKTWILAYASIPVACLLVVALLVIAQPVPDLDSSSETLQGEVQTAVNGLETGIAGKLPMVGRQSALLKPPVVSVRNEDVSEPEIRVVAHWTPTQGEGGTPSNGMEREIGSSIQCWCNEPGSDGWLESMDLGGPARVPAAGRYRIRSGDLLQFTYQQTRQRISDAYRLSYGDQVRITSDTHPELNMNEPTEVLPDGTISIPGVQSVQVNHLTLDEARQVLEHQLVTVGKYNSPRVTLLPVRVYQKLQDLLDAVDSRFGNGGQGLRLNVVRDGTVALPSIGTVNAIGLTREELMEEINARYDDVVEGIHVTVNVIETAPAFVYVLGQVNQPGRMEARLPMTLNQAIAQAGGHLQGGKVRQVVVVRRTEDWRLVARCVDLGFMNEGRIKTVNDLWLWDSDIVIVPKDRIQRVDELIDMYLTRGAYSLIPNQFILDKNTLF